MQINFQKADFSPRIRHISADSAHIFETCILLIFGGSMKATDVLSLSFRTLRSNKLRSGITVSIIALGITALVGIITAIQAMNQKLTESFSTMGASGFTIRWKERNFRMGGRQEPAVKRQGQKQEKKSNLGQPITPQQAELFKERFTYPAQVGISCVARNVYSVATSFKKTTPTVNLFGGDENNLELNGQEITVGRNFTLREVGQGDPVCILGHDVATKLFGDEPAKAVGHDVRIQTTPYRVIAVLKSRGTTFGFSRDNIAIIPYRDLIRNFPVNSFTIGVKAAQIARVEEAMGEAEGTFRGIRSLAVTEANNFSLERSNSLVERAIKSLQYLTVAVTMIGMITLIGAAIGLMNIMLVAVAERTKEVGLLKAVGAKKKTIQLQFLSEAILISLAGALIGIAAGIGLGNLFGWVLDTRFLVPWNWIIYGVGICTFVGLAAGLYPAWKAGNLNPIEALRYE